MAGHVKTRLAARIGAAAAAAAHLACTHDTLRLADGIDGCRRYLYLAGEVKTWSSAGIAVPPGWMLEPQRGRGLGERLERAFREVFRRGASKAIALGVDTPWMGRERLRIAFDWLERDDVVLGPCSDGGYYLLGLRGLAADVFHGVGWGTRTVLASTRRALESAGASYRLLPPDFDLDRWEDVERARDLLRNRPERAPALAAWLDRMPREPEGSCREKVDLP